MKNQNQTSQKYHDLQNHHSRTLRRDLLSKPGLKKNHSTLDIKPSLNQIKNSGSIISNNPHVTLIDKNKLDKALGVNKSESIRKFNFKPIIKHTPKEPTAKKGYIYDNFSHLDSVELLDNGKSIFEKAVEKANYYQSIPNKISEDRKSYSGFKAKFLITSASLVIIFLGYLTYINIPNYDSGIISKTTGFIAKIPSYNPPGFYLNKQINKLGYLSVSYISNTDSRQYSLNETPTTMNNQELKNNFVIPNYSNYLNLKFKNQEIFIKIDKSEATWVKNNTWYKLVNNSALSLNQIVQLATSN